MNTDKTAGQIAHDAWHTAKSWDEVAAAVIAHHEASRAQSCNPQRKFKVGDRIRRVKGPRAWCEIGYEAIVTEGYRYNDVENDNPLVVDSYWEKVEWTLPAPPTGRSWHRQDWREDMLSDGWRPLLASELDGATHYDLERLNPALSDRFAGDGWVADPTEAKTCFYRTRRPLPPAHEVKITLQTIKLQTGKWSIASV